MEESMHLCAANDSRPAMRRRQLPDSHGSSWTIGCAASKKSTRLRSQAHLALGMVLLATPMLSMGCRVLGSSADTQSVTSPPETNHRLTAEEAAPAKAIDRDKSRVDLLLALAANHERHKNLTGAIETYERILQIEPQHLAALHRLALAYDQQGDHQRADDAFQRCQTIAPDDPSLLADLGYRAYLQDDWDKAEDYFRKGLAAHPDSARLHNNYGVLLVRNERYRPALDEFRAGGCSRAEAYANLGHLCVMEARWDEAYEFLSIAAEDEHEGMVAQATIKALWPNGYEDQPTPPREALVAFESQATERR